jgi:RNA recognition motif-containing protein
MKIFVGNLSYGVSTYHLNDLFTPFGEVTSAEIIINRESGKPVRFAFVEMTNRSDGQKAIDQLNGRQVQGRTISVCEAGSVEGDLGNQGNIVTFGSQLEEGF